MKFKNRIREVRNQLGLSGKEIASKLNISTQYLYDIERGKRGLSAEIAAQLSEIFNVKTDYLIGKEVQDSWVLGEEKSKYSPDHEGSELSEIPIERLNKYKLSYKGHQLSKEEADDVIELLEASLKRWKK